MERKVRDDHHSVRPQSLCHGSGVSERCGALRSRKARARCWLPAMGRVFALSDSRDGRSNGTREILAERLGFVWRNFRIADCGLGRIWTLMVPLPTQCGWEALELLDCPCVFPDHVRADGTFRRVRCVFCVANHESLAAL